MLFLRKHGIIVKGMRRLKGRRKPSLETMKVRKSAARKVRVTKEKKSAEQALKELRGRRRVVSTTKPTKVVRIHNFLK
jgi:hypothetical protein